MQFSFTYPMATGDHDPALTTRNGMYSVLAAAEAGGFGAVGFTDHPIPSRRWLEAGGHETLDPFAALAFCAAATEQIRLMTNVAVVPYRNPFLVAKMVATVDVLSDGRAILGAGTGYLRSEYRALGVDFDKRNELFEEALEAIISSWSGDEVTFEGSHFHASGNQARPRPVQRPHPPIWIGGNSGRARQRVAATAQGWMPFPTSPQLAATARTAPLATRQELAPMLEDLWRRLEAVGRETAVDVHFVCPDGGSPAGHDFDVDAHLTGLNALEELGVTWVGVSVPGDRLERTVEALQRYGEEVIRRS
jgi:probable F420-dependent oxidoreductase